MRKYFLERDGNRIRIFRTILHYRLIDYVSEYCNLLQEESIAGNKLRRLFARKMDNLFDIPSDPEGFDWWIDRE